MFLKNKEKKMEMEKENLMKIIKEWLKNDNEIREYNKIQKEKKKEKQILSEELIRIMKMNDVDVFDINGGKIQYYKKNFKKPISKKFLIQVISDYYKEDQEKAIDLNNYILNNREDVEKEVIIRKIDVLKTT